MDQNGSYSPKLVKTNRKALTSVIQSRVTLQSIKMNFCFWSDLLLMLHFTNLSQKQKMRFPGIQCYNFLRNAFFSLLLFLFLGQEMQSKLNLLQVTSAPWKVLGLITNFTRNYYWLTRSKNEKMDVLSFSYLDKSLRAMSKYKSSNCFFSECIVEMNPLPPKPFNSKAALIKSTWVSIWQQCSLSPCIFSLLIYKKHAAL